MGVGGRGVGALVTECEAQEYGYFIQIVLVHL